MTKEQIECVRKLIAAAKPFLSGDVVDETSGTIPLLEQLEDAISDAENMCDEEQDKD